MGRRFDLFASSIGAVGLVWTPRGITGVQIPAQDDDATLRTLRKRFPDATEATTRPEFVSDAIAAMRGLLAGDRISLAAIPLDLDGVSDFELRVYDIASAIPVGETLSYGEIATRLGDPLAARAVGRALGHNPVPIIIPCHRVLAAGGRSGGFSAPGGATTKLRLLAIEGATPGNQFDLFGF